jgi:hypothetical protein
MAGASEVSRLVQASASGNDEINQLPGMPIGSVGPTLRRSLDRLRLATEVRTYLAAAPTASRGTGGDQRGIAE